jgi:hypothetical protein
VTEPSAAVAPTILIVRPRDLVVLAVRWTGCDVRTSAGVPVLVASGSSPTVTLTFPPQALLEQTTTQSGFYTESNVYSQSRLSGVSELVFRVTPGATIGLTAAGVLQALGKVDSSSAVEMPWGLRLQPLPQTTEADVLSKHAANVVPIAGSGVVGLWQARLRAADGSAIDARLVVRPQMAPTTDPGISAGETFDLPPLHNWRQIIATNGADRPPRATRLELSALGGSLSCAATWPDSSWSHELRIGRDQNVQVTALGRLWPFGHRVAYQVFIRRAFLPVQSSARGGTVAALHARHVLVILERTRTHQRAPTFPFDDVEILGQEFLLSGAPGDPQLFIPEANGVLRIPVRCRSGTTDVRLAIPVIFAGDNRQPTTALLNAWKAHALVTIPGVALDMIGADGQAGDIHEVRSLTFDAVPDGATFRPKLDKFEVVLPALRSLLPGGGHDTSRTLRYAAGLRADAIPRVPLVFDETSLVDVNFTKNTDRSGGLVAPRFTANGIARDLGPVATGVLDPPDLPQALATAFAGATLFGFPLAALIDTSVGSRPGAPAIIQKRVGGADHIELRWEAVKLQPQVNGPFKRHPDPTLPPPQLDLTVTSNPQMLAAPDSPTCKLSYFMLALPPSSSLMTIAFKEVRFIQRPKEPMTLAIDGLNIQFVGALRLLQELQARVMTLLGNSGPTVSVSTTELVVGYVLRIPDAPAGMFVMRNIAVRTEVHVPFATDPVRVVVGFASREQPFGLTVSGFGGGGYVALEIAGDKPSRLELSLEFGAMVALDFVVAKAEVHAFGGVRFVSQASGLTVMEAFIRIGGSAQLLGLITISIELRVALTFVHDPPQEPRLTGRASIVIELDLTLYSETVTVDSGTYELIGGSSPLGTSLGAGTSDTARQAAWEDYWKAFA